MLSWKPSCEVLTTELPFPLTFPVLLQGWLGTLSSQCVLDLERLGPERGEEGKLALAMLLSDESALLTFLLSSIFLKMVIKAHSVGGYRGL